MMKLTDDAQILDRMFRLKVIEEINGQENQARKQRQRSRYEIYKDKIKPLVIENFRKEGLKEDTLALISNRATSINLLKKVINKLARSYLGDVKRDFEGDESNKFSDLEFLLDINLKMRKADRLEKLHNNCLVGVLPKYQYEVSSTDQPKFNLDISVLGPWQYDVIEDVSDKEKARCVILSEAFLGAHQLGLNLDVRADGVDQTLADSDEDVLKPAKPQYIFWTKTYHLTCDSEGNIVADKTPEDMLNPIQTMPWVTVSEKQDGTYWADGGDDLSDGTILINTMLTDMIAIANIQGWGQLVIKGKNLSDTISGGPHRAILLEQNSGDPEPSVSFENANPPLDAWAQMVEQYVALLLTTNDLSPGQVSSKLDASGSPASGVSLMIDRSEALDNVKDRQKMFSSAERKVWDIVTKWQNLLFDHQALSDEFYAIGQLPPPSLSMKFHEARAVLTEKERLENMKARKELGIVDMVDLIMMDNPDMTEHEAEEKALELAQGRVQEAIAQGVKALAPPAQPQADMPMDTPDMPDDSVDKMDEAQVETPDTPDNVDTQGS